MFTPVVLENFQHCKGERPGWLEKNIKIASDDPDHANVVDGLNEYHSREQRFSHLVDGGITDNLGLRSIFEIIELSGGIQKFLEKKGNPAPRHVIIISVDASTMLDYEMDKSSEPPSIDETVSAISKIQMTRYNATTMELIESSLDRWVKQLSQHGKTVTPYFIQIQIDQDNLTEPELQYLNDIPTSFSLSDQQIDTLIQAGRRFLKNNKSYKRLVENLTVQ